MTGAGQTTRRWWPAHRVWIGVVLGSACIAAAVGAVARRTVFDLYPEDYARSVTRFVAGAREIEVDLGQPWARLPRILPGPADAWAGGTAHMLTLPLGRRPHVGVVLHVFLADPDRLTPEAPRAQGEAAALSSPPSQPSRLAVAVNGTIAEISAGIARRSLGSGEGVPTHHKIEIPATVIGDGSDVRLSLINQSGPMVVLERIRLVEARPTFAWANLGRWGRFPPESALFLGASLGALLLWNIGESSGDWIRRTRRASGLVVALGLIGLAEVLPLDRVTMEVPRWGWLALPWLLLPVFRPQPPRRPAVSRLPAESLVQSTRARAWRAAVILVYLVGVLLFLEGVSRVLLSVDALFVRVANVDEEAWWRLQWIHRKSADTTIYYAFDEYHPARGWALKPHARILDAFAGDVVVTSNSRGVRGPREYADPKPAGVTRILVFGDSLTFGDEVSDHQSYSAYLEETLPDTEVLNLGVHGYGHDQMLLYLREVGASYQPDVVLLGFVSEDMDRNLLGFRDFAKPRMEVAGDRLVLRNTPVPRPEDVLAQDRHRSRFVDLLTLLYDELRSPSTWSQEQEKELLTAAILDEFRRTIATIGAPSVFVYLPVADELSRADGWSRPEEVFFERYCRDRQVRALNLRPYYQSQLGTGFQFMTRGHWSPRQHQMAAEAIKTYLVEQRLVPEARRGQARLPGHGGRGAG